MGADFSGYATKAGLKCSDGRTIMPHAFKSQDGMTVPLVWQHGHNDPANVLGHALLENREDGVYCYGYFNTTEAGKSAKTLVQHQDITALSIYANKLVEQAKQVLHGAIREVSLVLSGANPGAFIDNVNLAHADGSLESLEDEAIIYTGLPLEHEDHAEVVEEEVEHAEDKTLQEVYDTFTEEQKNVVHFMIGAALEVADTANETPADDTAAQSDDSAEHSDEEETSDSTSNADETDLEHTEGNQDMSRNVFENKPKEGESEVTLSHSDIQAIVADAQSRGSLKAAVESYALAHGITDIDLLFPDAKSISDAPEFNSRRVEWVAGVISGTRHSPFSRIKTLSADLTFDEARAKGYIKGSLKKEEFFGVAKRVTTPTTIYKKQKLDRDDIVDITDFDVVSWLKAEMRLMLEEEVARAVLIGDGRDVADEDKINEGNIRPIAKEDPLYATHVVVPTAATGSDIVDLILSSRVDFKGTGTPTFYTKESVLTSMLLSKDTLGRRLYRTVDELAAELRVAAVVPVEVMEDEPTLVGVLVNLQDYVIGADRGGEISMFDDFDIDYNQFKYLIETRLSGALVKIKSAVVYAGAAGSHFSVEQQDAPAPEQTEQSIYPQS